MTPNVLTCFKSYDIRGKLGSELNETIAYKIGNAYGAFLGEKTTVVVGSDVRLTSEALKLAVANGLRDAGVDVIDIGLSGTEEVYFATFHWQLDGGIEITASHNPIDYNGMKLVQKNAKPISGDSGLNIIQQIAESNQITKTANRGNYTKKSILDAYINHLLNYIDLTTIKPIKLVVNTGNGAAGHVLDALEKEFRHLAVPITFIKIHHEPDGSFPNGIPNPLLPENRADTANAVISHQADMGIAWDGDFDRCFLFDETGAFIEGYYIVGLLAEAFLQKHKGAKIIHDPRLTWNTIDIVIKNNGIPIQSKTGHAFIKERMRLEDAIYGGEMSAHHYFRDFAYCDSGMVPWLLITALVSYKNKNLSSLVRERIELYPCSGEINFHVQNINLCIKDIENYYQKLKPTIVDNTDGISMEFPDWRFNVRASNTEPILRVNIESNKNQALIDQQLKIIKKIIAQS